VLHDHSYTVLGWLLGFTLVVTGCANNPDARSLEQRLGADPQLTNSPGLFGTTQSTPIPTPRSDNPGTPSPTPGNGDVAAVAPTPSGASAGGFQDLQQAPQPLQNYVIGLANLGALTPVSPTFQPNDPITRRDFIRWLVTAQNKIYANRPARQIRLTATATSVFKDVPKTDPDFATIQGAAEAGLIASSLSGDATAIAFRPDAPLTRETLLMWKVPLDFRKSLPTASVDSVKEVWGFQDAAKISPPALKAVLADHQNGDLANINRVYGYTALFQPQRSVTRAEAAASLWYFGVQGDGFSADDALQAQNAPESPESTMTPSPTVSPTVSPTTLSPTPGVNASPLASPPAPTPLGTR
jgi:hypothetical protein